MVDYQGRAPGVYIEEITAVGPIPGVGTSIAAFIGPASMGAIDEPVKVTNWTQFANSYGDTAPTPQIYLTGAVRGFFDNGGTSAYVIRVGTGTKSKRDLVDENDEPALTVRASVEGPGGQQIKVGVGEAAIATNIKFLNVPAKNATAAGATITLKNPADASLFAVGDFVDYDGKRGLVTRVRSTGELVLAAALPDNTPADRSVRIADPIKGQKTFRLSSTTGVQRGTVLQVAQGNTNERFLVDNISGGLITIRNGLAYGYTLLPDNQAPTLSSVEFSLEITDTNGDRTYANLAVDPRHTRYWGRIVDDPAVTVTTTEDAATPPLSRPKTIAAAALEGGTADDPSQITRSNYQAALDIYQTIDEISLICVPDAVKDPGIQSDVRDHCETMKDRFAILDAASAKQPIQGPTGVLTQRETVRSRYTALYYPWISVPDPRGSGTIDIPPSGHIAGIYARSDAQFGVHKAPANESIVGAVGLSQALNDTERGALNFAGVNALRTFGAGRPVVWGARTTSDETQWRYVNIRRLFLFVEESIQEGLQWAVFQPNDLSLRKKLERTITEFLLRVWASGALFGASAEEAFYVKIDDENNPPDVRARGEIYVEIGLAPVAPAEFVIVRIGMSASGNQVQER